MATLTSNVPTLMDVASRNDPDGKYAQIAELLHQLNPILDDVPMKEGNLATGHQGTVRTGLPSTAFRRWNDGITPSKSTTQKLEVGCAQLAAMSQVDVDIAKLNGHSAAFRASESVAFLESMAQTMATQMFYGNVNTDPAGFTGFTPLYNAISGGATAQNIVTGGGSGSDNTSLWLVGWGMNTVHGIYPKGQAGGLQHEDKGQILVPAATGIGGAMLDAYVDIWKWNCALFVQDWRYVVRGPNIDISNLEAESSAADVVKMMIKMYYKIPSFGMCRPAFYTSRRLQTMLHIQALSKASSQLTVENFDGKQITTFLGIPVKCCDAITTSEATVS